ncbi:MAG TPA: hypothetical protein ENI12_03120 [Nitrospirae bacterium]|nr:hypothetical protein [Nitrospirota bacterium]
MKKLLLLFLMACMLTLVAGTPAPSADEGVFYEGDVIYTIPVMSVIFSHRAHVEDLGLGCDMCHPDLFMMSNLQAQENDDFTMQSLYDGKYCGACHDGSWAFASDTQCARCHIGVKGFAKATGLEETSKGH